MGAGPQCVRSRSSGGVESGRHGVEVVGEQVAVAVQRQRRRLVFYMRVIGVPPAIGRGGRGFSWREVVVFVPCLIRHQRGAELAAITLGHPLLDEYLAFVAARARINTWLAVASDLKIFFGVVAKEPAEVTAADVFAFLAEQRKPRLGERVVRLEDGEAGLAARTIARRLSSVRGLYAYLAARGDTGVRGNPVPTSLAARRRGARRGNGGVPLIRTPRTLPRVLSPAAGRRVGGGAAHAPRPGDGRCDGAGRAATLRGARLAARGCQRGQRRLFVAEGKGGRQRIVPLSARFFASLGSYLEQERPATARTEQVFVVLKGPRRGAPLSPAGVDEILDGARARAGLQWATCHQLRHTCFTRLREAGMALEAIQAQAGHASIESTRIYLHLADDWLAKEYLRAAEAIEAQAAASVEGSGGERLIGAARRRRGDGCRIPGRPGRGGYVRRAPGDIGGPHVLHPDRRRRVGPIAAGAAVRAAAQGAPGGRLVDRDGTVPAQPRLPGGLPALPGRGRRPPSPGVSRPVRARSAELGFDRIVTRLQWSALVKVAAVAGVTPEQLTKTMIQAGREALVAAIGRHRPDSHGPKALSAALFGAQTTLFHLGLLDAPPRKTNRDRSAERAAAWESVPTRLAATLTGYIAQTRLSLRASTMVRVEGVLREFACWLAVNAPEVGCVADLRRSHIESYKLHLATRPSARGGGASHQDQPGRTPRRTAHLLRTPHRMGRRRRAGQGARVRRRSAPPRRAVAPLPRRRRFHQTVAGHPRRLRPVRAPGRRIPGPNRPA